MLYTQRKKGMNLHLAKKNYLHLITIRVFKEKKVLTKYLLLLKKLFKIKQQSFLYIINYKRFCLFFKSPFKSNRKSIGKIKIKKL